MTWAVTSSLALCQRVRIREGRSGFSSMRRAWATCEYTVPCCARGSLWMRWSTVWAAGRIGALHAKGADKLAKLLLVHRGEDAEPDELARVEGVRQGGGRPAGDDGTVHGEGVPPHVHRQGAVRLQVAAQGDEEGFDGQGVSG